MAAAPERLRFLIIEDDRTIAANLYDYLEGRGHAVDAAADGVTGLHLAVTHDFDAIVLDLGLPGMDGLYVCRKLRTEAHCDAPVLMLTARDTLEDKRGGFAAGADDYLVKPFALGEVEMRLIALARRRQRRVVSRMLRAGALTLDPRTLEVAVGGRTVKLPPKGLRLLEVLMSDPGRVFSRAELEAAVWGEAQASSDTLRSQMHLLRRALVEAGVDTVENVHGMGYRLADDGRA
ncbi:MAG: response regulator transcription factor [Burkholderiales bacterium]